MSLRDYSDDDLMSEVIRRGTLLRMGKCTRCIRPKTECVCHSEQQIGRAQIFQSLYDKVATTTNSLIKMN